MIIGAGRAVDRLDAERGDKGFGGGEAFALGQDRPGFGRVAIDLIGVEQAERLGEKPAVVVIVAGVVILRRNSFQRMPRLECSPLRTCAPSACHWR
jgi:hypothetical protein